LERKKNSDSEDDMHIRRRIELYLRRTRMAPTRFGREAAGDPRLVLDLRNGRELRAKTSARLHAWLDRHEPLP
jgi:hypothetical protein